MLTTVKPAASSIPFDTKRLDRLMDEAGIDVLLATSKHNVQYLLGGHRAFFFDYMDAMGLSRYLPIVVYPKGAPEKAAFFGHRLENFQREVKPFWTPEAELHVVGLGRRDEEGGRAHQEDRQCPKRVGVEMAFLPMDSAAALKSNLPDAEIVDALFVLERLRALKSPAELEMLRVASERVIESMQAVIAKHGPGTTKQEIADALKVEEVNRGLTFEYCLIAAGASHNRAPSAAALGGGRRALGRLRRQLPRLYRRPRAHGDPGRARRRARGPAGRDRGHPARRR